MHTPIITGKSPQFTNHLSSMYPKENTNYKFENYGFLLDHNYIYHFFVRPLSILLNNQHQVSNRENTQSNSSILQNNNASSINSTNNKCQTKKSLKSVSYDLQR